MPYFSVLRLLSRHVANKPHVLGRMDEHGNIAFHLKRYLLHQLDILHHRSMMAFRTKRIVIDLGTPKRYVLGSNQTLLTRRLHQKGLMTRGTSNLSLTVRKILIKEIFLKRSFHSFKELFRWISVIPIICVLTHIPFPFPLRHNICQVQFPVLRQRRSLR